MSGNDGRIIVVLTTCGSRKEAEGLAKLVVNEKIAACAQVLGPIKSFYWWKDNLEEDEEWQVLLKMPSENFERACEFIKRHHSYELPEIVAIDVDNALSDYKAWVIKQSEK